MDACNGRIIREAGGLVGVWQRWVAAHDVGSLARLSRKDSFGEVLPYLAFEGPLGEREHAEDVAMLIGRCFGEHREHCPNVGPFGRSMRMMWYNVGDGFDRRANRVLQSRNLVALSPVLLSMVRWMGTQSVSVDFVRLYYDVYMWWAGAYYGGRALTGEA